jgi:hypothetical protein
MSRFWTLSKVLTGSSYGSTSAIASPPILLQPRRIALPNNAGKNENAILVPGSGTTVDLLSFTAEVITTGNAGTSPTLTTTIQGTNSFMDLSTTLTSAISSSATTVPLTAINGIMQYEWCLLMAQDGSSYEWVQVTSATGGGAGSPTIVRGQFGTTPLAFNIGDYFFFTRSWVDIPTPNATTTTMTTGAVNIGSASSGSPVIATIDAQSLGMNRIPFPIIRARSSVGGSSTPTATFQVNLSGLIQSTDAVRAR